MNHKTKRPESATKQKTWKAWQHCVAPCFVGGGKGRQSHKSGEDATENGCLWRRLWLQVKRRRSRVRWTSSSAKRRACVSATVSCVMASGTATMAVTRERIAVSLSLSSCSWRTKTSPTSSPTVTRFALSLSLSVCLSVCLSVSLSLCFPRWKHFQPVLFWGDAPEFSASTVLTNAKVFLLWRNSATNDHQTYDIQKTAIRKAKWHLADWKHFSPGEIPQCAVMEWTCGIYYLNHGSVSVSKDVYRKITRDNWAHQVTRVQEVTRLGQENISLDGFYLQHQESTAQRAPAAVPRETPSAFLRYKVTCVAAPANQIASFIIPRLKPAKVRDSSVSCLWVRKLSRRVWLRT